MPSPGRSCAEQATPAHCHIVQLSSSSAHRARSPRSETARPLGLVAEQFRQRPLRILTTDEQLGRQLDHLHHRQVDQHEEPHDASESHQASRARWLEQSCPPRRCRSRGQPATCSPGVNPDGFPRPRARDTGLRRRKATAPSSTATRRSPWPHTTQPPIANSPTSRNSPTAAASASSRPPTALQASRLIDQLKQRERSVLFEIAADREATTLRHGEHAPSSTPRDDEISGYGSHAHWRHTRPPGRR